MIQHHVPIYLPELKIYAIQKFTMWVFIGALLNCKKESDLDVLC
jgi:hypothetical protein